MTKFQVLPIIAGLCLTHLAYADVNINVITDDNPANLKSIPNLQSLRSVPTKTSYQAPYVHDLKNRYKVRTLFVESRDLPIVDIQLTFNAGAARDTEVENGLYGVANMAAQLMAEGTEKYNAQQIAAAFEQVGAQFRMSAYRDMFIVRLRVLSDPKKLEPALAMMMEVLNNSSFKNSSINLMLNNTQVGQKQLNENPNRLMSILFSRELYGNHPYAEPINGTNGSIKRINPILLKKFRDQFLVTQNMNIAITGKMSSREAQKLAERISGNLKQGEKAKPLPDPIIKEGFNIQHIPFNSSQAYVTMGHIATTRDDPDRLALELANRMLGGSGFNSILMKELRVKRGYTYGATSSFSFSQSPGVFSLNYSTRQDQLVDSIRVAHKALVDFVQQPIDKKLLEETKTGLLRSFPMNYSSNATINSQLGNLGFYNQPSDYLNNYANTIAKITAKDVQNAVKKHIHPDQLTLVIVSKDLDKDEIEQILKENLNPSVKLKTPSTDDIPAINTPPQKPEEVVLPELVQPDELAPI
jgi:zinc protease